MLLAYVTPFDVWFSREPHFLRAQPLNPDNKPCNADGNVLVFKNGEVDTGASDGGYPDNTGAEADTYSPIENELELEEFILTAIEQCICKNNVLVAARMVKKTSKRA
jgi:hypothetical protein